MSDSIENTDPLMRLARVCAMQCEAKRKTTAPNLLALEAGSGKRRRLCLFDELSGHFLLNSVDQACGDNLSRSAALHSVPSLQPITFCAFCATRKRSRHFAAVRSTLWATHRHLFAPRPAKRAPTTHQLHCASGDTLSLRLRFSTTSKRSNQFCATGRQRIARIPMSIWRVFNCTILCCKRSNAQRSKKLLRAHPRRWVSRVTPKTFRQGCC